MAYDLIAYLRDKFPALATPLGETQCLELVEQFLDHLRVIAAHDGVARVGLGKTAADGVGKLRTDRIFRDYRQEALRSGDLRLRKRVDEFVEDVAADHGNSIHSLLRSTVHGGGKYR